MTKAITLTQPWATLVALGTKTVETRSWQTGYRGPLLIHAGKRGTDLELEADLKARWLLPSVELPRGAIVARVRLADIRPTSDVGFLEGLNAVEVELGDYSRGRFCWILADVEIVDPPIPWTGALGLGDGPSLGAYRRATG
jgi:hypothetical protein